MSVTSLTAATAASTRRPGSGSARGLLAATIQFTAQLTRDGLQVHEVAEPSSGALPHLVLTAAGFTEVSHRSELSVDWSSVEPAVVQVTHRLVGILLSAELDIDVANQVITQVVADVHLLNFSILLHFNKDFFEEIIIMLLDLKFVQLNVRAVCCQCSILWIQVQVLHEDRLTEGRFVVKSGASFSMTTSSYFEVE